MNIDGGYELGSEKLVLIIENNSEPLPKCPCRAGLVRVDGECVDVDECLVNNCDANANCTNRFGSFECTCNEGFDGNGEHCTLAQKCREKFDCFGVFEECVWSEEDSEFSCGCSSGYESVLQNEGAVCRDLDECENGQALKCYEFQGADCVNFEGGFDCECGQGGFTTSDYRNCTCPEGKTWAIATNQSRYCEDINECEENTGLCSQYFEGACSNLDKGQGTG